MAGAETAVAATGDAQPQISRRRITMIRAGEGVPMDHESMPFVGVDEDVMANFAKLSASVPNMVDAAHTEILFRMPGENGMSLSRAWFKSGYITPRHSHNSDCLYYILSGEARFGSARLGPGEGIFIPANDGYVVEAGPEGCELLEYRNAAEFNIHFKDNDAGHWDRIARSLGEHMTGWDSEVRPSERQGQKARS